MLPDDACEPDDAAIQPLLNWSDLLTDVRLDGPDRKSGIASTISDHRTAHERDYDRAVFCSPVRRLKDKTQVFPLDMHDGVRTRLTHSLEVSNLARSMGVAAATQIPDLSKIGDSIRSVPALLAAIALTHDLGNPPFGHQGEEAMRNWVEANEEKIRAEAAGDFDRELMKDFINFEGNAQGFRILTRLQHQDFRSGLRLTASTLRAFMKYPWTSGEIGRNGRKKFGCFHSETDVFNWASDKTRLAAGVRHPLSYLMEVCDDIAYSVLDVEDGVKKELVSVAEFATFLSSPTYVGDARVGELLARYESDRVWLNAQEMPNEKGKLVPLSSKEIRDAQVDILRSYAIGLMVSDGVKRFVELESNNSFATLTKGIAEDFGSTKLISGFKEFALLRIYKHPDVLRAEMQGHNIIPKLMTAFWRSIVAHGTGKASKADEFVMSLISPNYVRVYQESHALKLPKWYRQVQLVCDQVCGMTDSFSIRTYENLVELGAL